MLKTFRVPLVLTALALLGTFLFGGVTAAITVAIISVLEITFSFDNAVVNAKILGRMNAKWQKLFLTVGIVIAVFGMRLLFPLIVVALAAHFSPWAALQLAIQHPDDYAKHLTNAHPAIAAFGSTFLAMLFMGWLFEEREVYWLRGLEEKLVKLGKLESLPSVVMTVALVLVSSLFGHSQMVLVSGLLGLGTFLLVDSLDGLFEEDESEKAKTVKKIAKAGLATFLYLEVLDASFSFDGVVGAFAISSNIFLIAIGLGIGAIYIRSLTVYLVRKGTLGEYIYLDHGAHFAIGALAILLLCTIKYEIPEIVTGLIGLGFIGAALGSSIKENRKAPKKSVRLKT